MSDKQDDIDTTTAAALKDYVDDRIESLRENQERQWYNALRVAGTDRETIEAQINNLTSHGMTRRAAMGALAASVFGAGVLSGQAVATPGDDGDTVWGASNNRDDYYADEIDANLVSTGITQTETIGAGEYHYAGDYDGADPDARLGNALSAASPGNLIYLENAEYNTDRTFSNSYVLIGTFTRWADGSILMDTQWTFDSACRVVGIGGGGPADSQFQINADRMGIFQVGGAVLQITFASGTQRGLVDGAYGEVTVTDNGTNSVGDLV